MSIVSLDRPSRDCVPRLTDLDAERASFRLEVPERFNAVCDIVDPWALEDPGAAAVVSVDAWASWSPSSLRLIWLVRRVRQRGRCWISESARATMSS